MRFMPSRWEWKMRAYYGPDAKPPKVPGELAIETVHTNRSSLDMEVATAESRSDIGEVDIERLR